LSEGYFSISAESGAYSDNHDFRSFGLSSPDSYPFVLGPKSEPVTQNSQAAKPKQDVLSSIKSFQDKIVISDLKKETLDFKDKELLALFNNFESFCNDTHQTLKTLLQSHKVYSDIAFKLATNPPSISKSDFKDLIKVVDQLRNSVKDVTTLADTSQLRSTMLDSILSINKHLGTILDKSETLLGDIRLTTSSIEGAYKKPFLIAFTTFLMYAQVIFVVFFIIKQNISTLNILKKKSANGYAPRDYSQ